MAHQATSYQPAFNPGRYSLPVTAKPNHGERAWARPKSYVAPGGYAVGAEDDGTSRQKHPYGYQPYRPVDSVSPMSSPHTPQQYPSQAAFQRPSSSSGSDRSVSVYSTNEDEPSPVPRGFAPKPERKFTSFLGEQPTEETSTWKKIKNGLKPGKKAKKPKA